VVVAALAERAARGEPFERELAHGPAAIDGRTLSPVVFVDGRPELLHGTSSVLAVVMQNRALVFHSTTAARLAGGWRRPAAAVVTFAVGALSALALASVLALALATALAAVHAVIETPTMRRRRAMRATRKGQRKRRDKRERRLEQANVPSDELEELGQLVEHVTNLDQTVATDFESLLDRYVEIATEKRRCASALERGEPSRLEVQLANARERYPNSAAVLERRILLGHRLAARVRALDESLGEFADLVRYYAERASIADVELLFECDTPENCLALYDAYTSLDACR
jgi:hypothetical protein